ncbi:MAG: hypothetical protein NTV97_25695 [Alphaproteobacteria bacterium]|nr:hypothetical protein [Alphaproteobacteria bacterium]
MYQYYRRPPKGVAGSAFVRSFRSKDRKTVSQKYAAIHDEAEKYFERLVSGRQETDEGLMDIADSLYHQAPTRTLSHPGMTAAGFRQMIQQRGNDRLKSLAPADLDFLVTAAMHRYAFEEVGFLQEIRSTTTKRVNDLRDVIEVPAPTTGGLTLMGAYEQAWMPSAKRSAGTTAETLRFVNDFIALNGDHSLIDLTRDHWAKWRANCLELHGPGWTALKRFSMVKTVVSESIRAGLFERKNHAGQDVTMKKPARSNLRNEGWSDDELKELFASDPFTVFDGKHRNAEYWVPVIIALTGARLSEITGMNVPDVGKRHGVLTFFLARDEGKTEESRRIIPVPTKLVDDLGLLEYIATLDPKGPLFPGINSDIISKWFGRHRKSIGVNRKGCDIHAMRHHIRTILRNIGAPDAVSDYVTGHAGDGNVGDTYGKTELVTALRYLDAVDLGVVIPKWKAA